MNVLLNFRFSEAARASKPKLPFGLVAARGVSSDSLRPVVETQKAIALERLRRTLPEIRSRVETFSLFFTSRGFSCPLPGQLRTIEKKGFPRISPFVDALLICEMTNGILMGVQDLNQIENELIYDIAQAGESFVGLRGLIVCKAGEIVLRDARAMIASYFQGPDRRTSVTPTTSSLLFYVFGAPGLPRSAFDDALQMAVDLVTPSATAVDATVFTV